MTLAEVNFTVCPGEIRAIIGPNGARKSMFFRCQIGIRPPSRRRIFFAGEDIAGLPQHRISQKGTMMPRTLGGCRTGPSDSPLRPHPQWSEVNGARWCPLITSGRSNWRSGTV